MSKLRAAMRRAGPAAVVVVGLSVSWSAAFGLPWDLDMTDSQAVKAYEQPMQPLPNGVVSQPNRLSPKPFVQNYTNYRDPSVAALVAPFAPTEQTVNQGEKMYRTYCAPCHGVDGINLGMVAQPGRVPAVPPLAGPAGRIAQSNLGDGYLYMTIRNGSPSKIMPPYGYMMTEGEMWSIVQYLRDDKVGFGTKYIETPAAPAEAPAEGN